MAYSDPFTNKNNV